MQAIFNAYTATIAANPIMLGFSSAFIHFKGRKNHNRIAANAMSKIVVRYLRMSIMRDSFLYFGELEGVICAAAPVISNPRRGLPPALARSMFAGFLPCVVSLVVRGLPRRVAFFGIYCPMMTKWKKYFLNFLSYMHNTGYLYNKPMFSL